ncbi:kinase-like protein [Peniophora sp. CONT]|nr:kinase-like protein [Peniophora sp. CONT]
MLSEMHSAIEEYATDNEDSSVEDDLEFTSALHDSVEDAEHYQLGGLHPIAIGDCFSQGRYKILHKLGHGGSSTVWLARDREGADPLVALKAMRADASSEHTEEISSLYVPKMLRAALPPSASIMTVEDHFFVHGPNGSHLFLVSPLAGPTIASMSRRPGRASGIRRLRASLAWKVAKQTAMALYRMHRAGVVHGDLTTSNILFSLSPHVIQRWSDAELYESLGVPKTLESSHYDGSSGASAARVAPIDCSRLTDTASLQESVVLSDFGQSYAVASPPKDYKPGTIINYFSPEARFEGRAGLEADVWALGCAIFEIRAGSPLFESFVHSGTQILIDTVSMLGCLPDPWWDAFKDHANWFEEDGEPKREEDQAEGAFEACKTSVREQLRSIGLEDEAPRNPDGPMFEATGVRMCEEEVDLLGDLLEKMLRYRPEERIKMDEVITHPWFALDG